MSIPPGGAYGKPRRKSHEQGGKKEWGEGASPGFVLISKVARETSEERGTLMGMTNIGGKKNK